MPKLPRITGAEAIKAFERAGFELNRISGSHHILKRDGHPYHLSIPVHGNKCVGNGLLKHQIEAVGLTVEQFFELLK